MPHKKPVKSARIVGAASRTAQPKGSHHIVTIGGGSGHSQVLKGLKHIPGIRITGICPSTDSGGATGILRDEYDGGGYIGDLTKCIAALTPNETIAQALMYRYDHGPLKFHSVKNILFHALTKVDSIDNALQAVWSMCALGDHRVLPVTEEKTELCATLRVGNVISGEANIDTLAKNPLWNPELHSIADLYLKPTVHALPAVRHALSAADTIVICPGDLYSSILPTLLPVGVRESIQSSPARIVIILNIMTKRGETDHYTAVDFIERIERHLGRPADIIIHNTAPIPESVRTTYALEQKVELVTPKQGTARYIAAPLAYVNEKGQLYSNPAVIASTLRDLILTKKKRA